MLRLLRSKRTLFIALSASAMVAGAASGAYAANASPGSITVCVHHQGGGLYAATRCDGSDSTLSLNAPAAGGPAGQAVYSGFHDAPISLPSSLGTIASLRIPADGNYAIFAKLTVWNGENVDDTLTCQLVAGADVDRSDTVLTGNSEPYADYAAMSLNVVHHFSRPGKVQLQCTGYGVTTTASWIKITAVRAGSLTNTALP